MYLATTDADIPAIVGLMNRAYRGVGRAAGWSTETAYLAGDRITEALLRADVAANPSAALLKWQDAGADAITGCVWLQPIGNGIWYLGSLAIDPARQNGGLGRTVLGAAEDWLRTLGATRVRMTVIHVREPLIGWYLRRGYTATGATLPYPYGDDRFGTPLRDDLRFVVLEKPL